MKNPSTLKDPLVILKILERYFRSQAAHQKVLHQGWLVADRANPFWFALVHAGEKIASNTFKVRMEALPEIQLSIKALEVVAC